MIEPNTNVSKRVSQETFLDRKQFAALMGVTRRTVEAWYAKGTGPACFPVSRRKFLYRLSDVHAWINNRVVLSQAEAVSRGLV